MTAQTPKPPHLTPMKLASDFGCTGLATATSVFGTNGSLAKKSAVDAAVAANEMVLLNTEGVKRLIAKPVMRGVTGSGSGTTRCKIHFYGLLPSGEGTASSDALDNPWLGCRLEMYQNSLASGNFTGVSDNPAVVSQTGNEFLSYHDWDFGAIEMGGVFVANFSDISRGQVSDALTVNTIAEVGSTGDDGNFAIINSVAPFDLCAFTFELGSLSAGIANIYYSAAY